MLLFICWSAGRSKAVAQALEKWLPSVMPDVEPFLSWHIKKGQEWFVQVDDALERAEGGIVCLTPENQESAWIHFEAGALKRSPRARDRVVPYLFGFESALFKGPLSAYQGTPATKDETRKMLAALAKVPETEWGPRFDAKWPELERALRDARYVPIEDVIADLEAPFRRKTFEKSVLECVNRKWLERYENALRTHDALEQQVPEVKACCRPFVADIYLELIRAIDSYAMELSVLIEEPESRENDERCERARGHMMSVHRLLLSPERAPVLDDAWRFDQLQRFDEKKDIIHRKEEELYLQMRADATSALEAYERCPGSEWAFDRIVYYLVQERVRQISVEVALDLVRMELEKARAKGPSTSDMPLHYSLGALGALDVKPHSKAVARVLDDVTDYLVGRDQGGQIKRTLDSIRDRLST